MTQYRKQFELPMYTVPTREEAEGFISMLNFTEADEGRHRK